jgi:photosystem II stability/assembly factor-like uncharacterized protein
MLQLSVPHPPYRALAALCPVLLVVAGTQAIAQSPRPAQKARGNAAAHVHGPLDSVSALSAEIQRIEAKRRVKGGEADDDGVKHVSGPATLALHPTKVKARGGDRARAARAKEESGTDWLEAYRFYVKQRAFPNDKVDFAAIKRGMKSRDRLPAAHLKPLSSTPSNGGKGSGGPAARGQSLSSALSAPLAAGGASPTWEFLGPRNLPVPYRIYYGVGATSGRVNAIAYTTPVKGQPDTTANTIYIGSAGGGVWKSTNGGYSWTVLSDSWPTLPVSSIAVDPTNPNRVYVGTGDFQGYAVYPFGVMKSTDGGATWTNTGQSQFGTTCVSHVVVDPESPNIVTVSTGNGIDFFGYVWRSTDFGATWSKAFDSPNAWSGLTISAPDKLGKRFYYAAGLGDIWQSADRGQTWTSIGIPAGSSVPSFPDVAASKIDNNTVYLLSPGDEKIFKSTDAGANWTDITGSFPGGYNWSQYNYDFHVTTSTITNRFGRTADAVYVGMIDIEQSPNAGGLWRSLGATYTDQAITHNDQHSMAVNPRNPYDMLVGNDGGVYRLTYNAKRDTWLFDSTPNMSLGITQFYHGAYHPYDPTKMLGGTQDNSTPASFGNLGSWGNVGGGDGGFSEIHPLAPNVQYATSQFGGLFKTTDGWKSSSQLAFGSGFVGFFAPIAIDPQDPNVLYGGTDTVWKYQFSRFGYNLFPLAPTLSNFGVISYIAVSPGDGKWIYAASSAGELFMTNDGGKNWSEIDQGATSLPNRYITGVAVSPDDPAKVVVTVSGTGEDHVWRCDNTVAAAPVWVDASGGLPDVPTNTVALDGVDPANTWYVGTDVGVFVTQDGGSSWSNMTQPLGLPNVQVNELRVTLGTGYLNAATYGRGMWRLKIANPIAPISRLGAIPANPRGGQTFTLVITMISPAPTGGQVVNLQSSNPAVIAVPAKVTVVAGFNIIQVPVSTAKVTGKTVVTITGSAGGKTRTLKLTVVP